MLSLDQKKENTMTSLQNLTPTNNSKVISTINFTMAWLYCQISPAPPITNALTGLYLHVISDQLWHIQE